MPSFNTTNSNNNNNINFCCARLALFLHCECVVLRVCLRVCLARARNKLLAKSHQHLLAAAPFCSRSFARLSARLSAASTAAAQATTGLDSTPLLSPRSAQQYSLCCSTITATTLIESTRFADQYNTHKRTNKRANSGAAAHTQNHLNGLGGRSDWQQAAHKSN